MVNSFEQEFWDFSIYGHPIECNNSLLSLYLNSSGNGIMELAICPFLLAIITEWDLLALIVAQCHFGWWLHTVECL